MAAFRGRRLLKLLFGNNLWEERSVRTKQTISAQALRTSFRHSAISSERNFAKAFFINTTSREPAGWQGLKPLPFHSCTARLKPCPVTNHFSYDPFLLRTVPECCNSLWCKTIIAAQSA